ncbi:MAG TPA: response regulator [Bryobacteraceae bacterium]|nr:response regulator [Bryobacteraceae bacterium]
MKTILIADDKDSSRELIRALLERSGYRVEEAADGTEAVERARTVHPDLILLDLQMPRLDGFGVLRELRQDDRFRDKPVVALTAYAMHGDREKALQAGFTSYVTKPVNLMQLREHIARLLQGQSHAQATDAGD